ncbi:MAG: type IV secretory system conjugative DNA transfer family protein [Bacillota bacterium]
MENGRKTLSLIVFFGVVGLAAGFLFPLLLPVLAVALLAWWLGVKSGRGASAAAAVVLMAAILAGGLWMAFTVRERNRGQELRPNVLAWVKTGEASPADLAARFGLLAGALAGLVISLSAVRRVVSGGNQHGVNVVQGRPVVKGGWADDQNVAPLCEFGPPKPGKYGGGVVLGRLEGRIVRIPVGKNGIAAHTAAFGTSGSGKTFGFVLPNIVSAAHEGWSMVISDPKGELVAGKWNAMGEYEPGIAEWLTRQGYRVIVLNFKNPSQGSHLWNPLYEARDDAEFRRVCEAMINCAGKENPFFAGGESNLFTSLVGLTKYNTGFIDDWRHMRTVLSLLAWPVEALDGEFASEFRNGHLPNFFYEKWQSSKNMFNNFATGVANKVAVMTDGPLAAVTAGHDIDLVSIAREKTVLFVILPTQGDLRPLLTAFYFLLFKRLVDFAEANHNRLPIPVRFILDELANIGRIPDFNSRVSFDRGLGINYICILQSLTQLGSLYGAADAETILGNMDVRMALRVNDMRTARYFAGMLGKARVKEISERRDVTVPVKSAFEMARRSETIKDMPLMEDWQFLEMPFFQAVARIPTCRPLYLHTLAFSEMREFRELSRDPKTVADFAPQVPTEVSTPPIPDINDVEPEPKRKRQRPRNDDPAGGMDVMELFNQS